MNGGSFVGAVLGVKLVNGKFKPKYGASAIIVIIIMVLMLLAFMGAFIYGITNFNLEFIIMPVIGIVSISYILLISPYTQRSSNYYIEFQNENTLAGFRLLYKGKLVNIQYRIDSVGKIAFLNNMKKTKCISYADGSKMSDMTKYKIINYFAKWLSTNNLLSNEVTVTFE